MGGIEIKSFTLVLNLSSSETELQVIFFYKKKIIKDNFEAPDLTSIITIKKEQIEWTVSSTVSSYPYVCSQMWNWEHFYSFSEAKRVIWQQNSSAVTNTLVYMLSARRVQY